VNKVSRSFDRCAASIGFASGLAIVLSIAVATSVWAREQTDDAPTNASEQKPGDVRSSIEEGRSAEHVKQPSLNQEFHTPDQNVPLQTSVTLVSIDYRATDADLSKRFFAGPLRAGSNEPIVAMPPQRMIGTKGTYKAEAVLDQSSPSPPAPLAVFTLQDSAPIEGSVEQEVLPTQASLTQSLSPPRLPPLLPASAESPSADDSRSIIGSGAASQAEKASAAPSPAVIAWNHALRKTAPAFVEVNDKALKALGIGWNAWYRRVGEAINVEFDKTVSRPAQFELNFHVLNSGSICVSFINGQSVDSDGQLQEGYGLLAEEVMQRVTNALANDPILTFPKGTHRSGIIFQMLLRKSQDGVVGYSPGNTIDGEVGTALSF
jgi:hypothetical protein